MLPLWLTPVVTNSQMAQKNKGICVHCHHYKQIVSGMCTSSEWLKQDMK